MAAKKKRKKAKKSAKKSRPLNQASATRRALKALNVPIRNALDEGPNRRPSQKGRKQGQAKPIKAKKKAASKRRTTARVLHTKKQRRVPLGARKPVPQRPSAPRRTSTMPPPPASTHGAGRPATPPPASESAIVDESSGRLGEDLLSTKARGIDGVSPSNKAPPRSPPPSPPREDRASFLD